MSDRLNGNQFVGANGKTKLGPMDWVRALTRFEPMISDAAVRLGLRLLDHYHADRGAFPTIETLGRGGIGHLKSSSSINIAIKELSYRGLIEIESGKSRGRQNTYWLTIPGSGRVGARRERGNPAESTSALSRWSTKDAGSKALDIEVHNDLSRSVEPLTEPSNGDPQGGEVLPSHRRGVNGTPVRGHRPDGDITQLIESKESDKATTPTTASSGNDVVAAVGFCNSSLREEGDRCGSETRRLRLALIDIGVTEPKLSVLVRDPRNCAERVWFHHSEVVGGGGVHSPVGLMIKRLGSPDPREAGYEQRRRFVRFLEKAECWIQSYFDKAESLAESDPSHATAIRKALETIRSVWPTPRDLVRARPLAFWVKKPSVLGNSDPVLGAICRAAQDEQRRRDANTANTELIDDCD